MIYVVVQQISRTAGSCDTCTCGMQACSQTRDTALCRAHRNPDLKMVLRRPGDLRGIDEMRTRCDLAAKILRRRRRKSRGQRASAAPEAAASEW